MQQVVVVSSYILLTAFFITITQRHMGVTRLSFRNLIIKKNNLIKNKSLIEDVAFQRGDFIMYENEIFNNKTLCNQ